jgi:hypothetical protein
VTTTDPVLVLAGAEKRLVVDSGEADAGTRTPDPLLTMEVLYQLSYVGANPRSYPHAKGWGHPFESDAGLD